MRRLIGGALAALTIVTFTPTAAHAAGEWREVEPSAFNTRDEKSAEASCPDGAMVVGSGGYIHGAVGNVVLTGVVPNANLDAVTVYAKALPGNTAPWSVVALAVCGMRDASVQREVGVSFLLGGNARAQCDPGKIVWSTGFNVPWATTTTYVSSVVPAADMSSVTVKGVATLTSAVTAYAICGHTSFLGGTGLGSGTTPLASQGQTQLAIDPPFYGGRVYGAGVSASRTGLFVDGLGMDWVTGYSWGVGRMSWLPGAAGLKSAARAGTASGDEMTVYATAIGSWYD